MKDGYHYALAFRRADGSTAGQVPVSVDWEPAYESTRFEAFRHHAVMPRSADEPRVVPIWHDTKGEPYVGGVRLSVDLEAVAQEFTLAYFGDLVQPAVQHSAAHLAAADEHNGVRHRFRLIRRARGWRLPAPRRLPCRPTPRIGRRDRSDRIPPPPRPTRPAPAGAGPRRR